MRVNLAMSTDHAIQQAAKRGISWDQIGVALEAGREIRGDGCLVRFVGRREVEQFHLDADAQGLCAVLTEDGRVLLTVYKNPNALWKFRDQSERVRRLSAKPDGLTHAELTDGGHGKKAGA